MPAPYGWNVLSAVGVALFVVHLSPSPVMSAPESPPAGESRQKEILPSEQKKKPDEKKSDPDTKSNSTGPKRGAEEKATKAEEPAAVPSKPEEPDGKKPGTSLNLTIKLACMADPLLFPSDLAVEMDGTKAVLTGTVPSDEAKVQAGEIAGKVEGVEAVVNKVTVVPALRISLTKKNDEAVTQYVKERLSRSETLKAVGFEVKSDNGIVSLSGKTKFQVIALEAAEAARHVPGVRAVNTTGIQFTGKDKD